MLGMALPLIYLPSPLCVCAHVYENACVCVCLCGQGYAEARGLHGAAFSIFGLSPLRQVLSLTLVLPG